MNSSDQEPESQSEPREAGAGRILKRPRALHTIIALFLLALFVFGFVVLFL